MERWFMQRRVRGMERRVLPHAHGRRVVVRAKRLGHVLEIECVKDLSGRTREARCALTFIDTALWGNGHRMDCPELILAYQETTGLWQTSCRCDRMNGFPTDAVSLVDLFSPSRSVADDRVCELFHALFQYVLDQPLHPHQMEQ